MLTSFSTTRSHFAFDMFTAAIDRTIGIVATWDEEPLSLMFIAGSGSTMFCVMDSVLIASLNCSSIWPTKSPFGEAVYIVISKQARKLTTNIPRTILRSFLPMPRVKATSSTISSTFCCVSNRSWCW